MARKPTGKPTGKPRKPIDRDLLNELHHEGHTGLTWDNYFDLYNYFQSKNAPDSVLTLIEDLIAKESDIETLELRNLVDEMGSKLFKTKSLNRTDEILGHYRVKLVKLRKESAGKETRNMISKIIGKINELRESSLLVTKDQIEKMYVGVGKASPSESLWILEHLDKHALAVLKRKYFQIGKNVIGIPDRLLDEATFSRLAFEAFDKVFRSATYDINMSIKEKRAYLNQSFYMLYLDAYNKYCHESDTEESYSEWIEGGMPDFTPPKRKLPPKKKKTP